MSKRTRILTVFLSVAVLLFAFPLKVSATPARTSPSLSARSAVLIEAESGRIICQKNADQRLPMASTTKIMTAMTAMELADAETVIRVSPDAVGVEGSSVYLRAGEELTLRELLYALLLESANDAAVAIAIGLCGSVSAFADEMNRCAAELSLTDTRFANPHGLDDENHYTTAYELAMITREAMRQGLFRTIVSTKSATIPGSDGVTPRYLNNHNRLLRTYPGCIGVKTGFTRRSGRCLVSAACRENVTLIAVTLDASSDWNDHRALFDYGFSLLENLPLCGTDLIPLPVSVVGGKESYVLLRAGADVRATLPTSRGAVLEEIEYPRFIYAPVTEGDTVGQILFRCDTDGDGTPETVARVDLVAAYSVEKKPVRRSFWQWLCSLFGR